MYIRGHNCTIPNGKVEKIIGTDCFKGTGEFSVFREVNPMIFLSVKIVSDT